MCPPLPHSPTHKRMHWPPPPSPHTPASLRPPPPTSRRYPCAPPPPLPQVSPWVWRSRAPGASSCYTSWPRPWADTTRRTRRWAPCSAAWGWRGGGRATGAGPAPRCGQGGEGHVAVIEGRLIECAAQQYARYRVPLFSFIRLSTVRCYIRGVYTFACFPTCFSK